MLLTGFPNLQVSSQVIMILAIQILGKPVWLSGSIYMIGCRVSTLMRMALFDLD